MSAHENERRNDRGEISEMTDNKIIKALECFVIPKDFNECGNCVGCAFESKGLCHQNMSYEIAKLSLDLINRQKAEVERLNVELDNKQFRCDSCDRIGLTRGEYLICIKRAKAEAIKEFAEKVKNKLWDLPTMSDEEGEYDYVCMESLVDYIDNLVKEMVGEQHDKS